MTLNVDLTVTLPDGAKAAITGTIADTDSEAAANPAAQFAAWLGSIDPTELEAATMAASDYSMSPTVTMLAVLKKWAGGDS